MKGIQNTSTENFSTIIGNNKKFYVPKFQRDYSWNLEQWDDLWQDIENMIQNEEEDHYMGYLVLQTNNDKTHFIIDGQQRFTTIMVLILAALNCIEEQVKNNIDVEDNKKRIQNLKNLYIGKEDPVSLDYDNILVLNRNNDAYYKDYIVKMDVSMVRGLKATEKLMRNCFLFFEGKLKGKFVNGKGYAQYIQLVVEKLYFTKIVVNDELNAFRVFETLNARGVQLSSSDLLKNYLFSLVDDNTNHESHINALEQKWVKLTDIIRSEKLPEFLRYFWNCKHKVIRSTDLFKTIRREIHTDKEVFELVDEMIRYSHVYMALMDSSDELWQGDMEIRDSVQLLNIFRVKQPYSALMSAWICLSSEDFKRLIKAIIVVCMRYNVICDKNPNDQDAPFNMISIDIQQNHHLDLSILSKIYVEDSEFERAFAEKSFPYNSRNVKVIRYILGKIDLFNGSSMQVVPTDEDASVEHVLPQVFSEFWNIDEARGNKMVDRLGNMTLLEQRLNRDLQNATYEEKQTVYARSSYHSSKEIADQYEEWTTDAILKRQQKMARIAKSIWRI